MSTTHERIRLPLPDSEGFYVTERDGLFLVVPKKNKWEWSVEERPYRSLILDADGYVVSSGMPKFFNYGEEKNAGDQMAILDRALANDETVWFTAKEDGSLCIRSVVRGEVVFRTRGSFDGGPFGPAMRKVAEDKYPVLLDPEFEPDRSLLFEFVSPHPDFKVVLSYEEDDLIFLGAVRHADLHLADWPELEQLADAHGLNLVEAHTLPTDIEQLLAEVKSWDRREGIVARCAGGQVLVKMKSEGYLALHRLRSHLTAKNIREVCKNHDVRTLDDFAGILLDQGGDWEMVQDAKPLVQTFIDGREQAARRMAELAREVGEAQRRYPTRKDFAVQFASTLPGAEKGVAFLLLDGKLDQAREKLEASILDEFFDRAEARDQARAELLEES